MPAPPARLERPLAQDRLVQQPIMQPEQMPAAAQNSKDNLVNSPSDSNLENPERTVRPPTALGPLNSPIARHMAEPFVGRVTEHMAGPVSIVDRDPYVGPSATGGAIGHAPLPTGSGELEETVAELSTRVHGLGEPGNLVQNNENATLRQVHRVGSVLSNPRNAFGRDTERARSHMTHFDATVLNRGLPNDRHIRGKVVGDRPDPTSELDSPTPTLFIVVAISALICAIVSLFAA